MSGTLVFSGELGGYFCATPVSNGGEVDCSFRATLDYSEGQGGRLVFLNLDFSGGQGVSFLNNILDYSGGHGGGFLGAAFEFPGRQ